MYVYMGKHSERTFVYIRVKEVKTDYKIYLNDQNLILRDIKLCHIT